MPIINNSQNFNPNALNVPDAYINIKRPPGFIKGARTTVGAVFGTASWGAMNTPELLGSPTDLAAKYGGISAAALNDPFDMATEAIIAFSQTEQENGIELWGIRIGDGTEAKAQGNLVDTTAVTPLNGIRLTAKHPGVLGNQIQAKISTGSKTGTFNVDLIPPAGLDAERYMNVAGGAAGVFWQNLANAINLGQNGLRGPSALVDASNVNASGLDPALATVTLSGGSDGRSGVAAANFIGSATADPPTGIYSLLGKDPIPSVIWCAGLTDNTVFATIQAFVDSMGMFSILPFPAGTTVSSAITTKKTLGIDTPNISYAKDWVYWFDSANGRVRLVSPVPFLAGRICALSPEHSPLNKAVFGVVGTERINDLNGRKTYSPADIGQMQENGILFIHNPIPAGPMWGIRHGSNSSSDLVRKPVEYARMTNWLAHSFDKYMGIFVGELQSTDIDDPLRAQVKLTFDEYLEALQVQRQIDGYKVVCDITNNPPSQVAKHIMRADVFVRYMSSVWYFIINLQGGTTVNVTKNLLDESQASQIGI